LRPTIHVGWFRLSVAGGCMVAPHGTFERRCGLRHHTAGFTHARYGWRRALLRPLPLNEPGVKRCEWRMARNSGA